MSVLGFIFIKLKHVPLEIKLEASTASTSCGSIKVRLIKSPLELKQTIVFVRPLVTSLLQI